MITNKQEKINNILAITSGKTYRVIKAKPSMNFTLVDRIENLFINDETGETLTWEQIKKNLSLT